MSVLIFRLRNVPEAEADAVRNLLTEHQIDWYETTAGNWSIAMPGIWLKEDTHADRARALIDEYQHRLSSTMRSNYDESLQSGSATTLWMRLRSQPLRMAGIIAFCLFILYITVNPFLQLIGYTR